MADRNFYDDGGNLPGQRNILFKFTVDGANAPALAASPLNVYITSVSRVSQGLFRLTLADSYRYHVTTSCSLNVNAAGQQRWTQPGPVANFGIGATGSPTVDILVVDNAGAVQDPAAANANNFISGCITCGDVGGV